MFNPKALPPRYKMVQYEARRARAYHNLTPYPSFSFNDWKPEERGSYPRCRPFVRSVVNRSATWLFGRGISFAIDGQSAEQFNEIWDANRMNQKMVMAARDAGQSGTLAIKFTYDPKDEVPVRLHLLDGVDHVRAYYDPHDVEKLLMVRIQYPYWDAERASWFWFREDITDQYIQSYEPLFIQGNGDNAKDASFDMYLLSDQADNGEWERAKRVPNKFGVINVGLVKNLDYGGQYGRGDLWGLWGVIDQLNFTADLAHKDNQRNVWPKEVYIDAYAVQGAVDPAATGVINIQSDDDGKNQAKYEVLHPSNPTREHLQTHYECLLREFYDASGSVFLHPEDITNKGNLTRGVLLQTYQPLIEITNEKRESYGENGVCKFLETMSRGLFNAGVKGWSAGVDVKAVWPDLFENTEDDLKAMTERYSLAVNSGFIDRARAAKELAQAEGVEDPDDLVAEVEDWEDPSLATEDAPPSGDN